MTLLGAKAPRDVGIPRLAIVLYYLFQQRPGVQVIRRNRIRPHPMGGQGWREEGACEQGNMIAPVSLAKGVGSTFFSMECKTGEQPESRAIIFTPRRYTISASTSGLYL